MSHFVPELSPTTWLSSSSGSCSSTTSNATTSDLSSRMISPLAGSRQSEKHMSPAGVRKYFGRTTTQNRKEKDDEQESRGASRAVGFFDPRGISGCSSDQERTNHHNFRKQSRLGHQSPRELEW